MLSPSTVKGFNPSNLALLQKLYRSRNFQIKIDKQPNSNNISFLVYGSINALSAKQRSLFRQHISKIAALSPIDIKLALFSSSVSKGIVGFSSLKQVQQLFKGTTYQLEISMHGGDEVTAYEIMFNALTFMQTLKFSEDVSFNFKPTLIRAINNEQIVPIRFAYVKEAINVLKQKSVRQDLVHVLDSAVNKII
jgi:hypothetical protein